MIPLVMLYVLGVLLVTPVAARFLYHEWRDDSFEPVESYAGAGLSGFTAGLFWPVLAVVVALFGLFWSIGRVAAGSSGTEDIDPR